MATIKHCLMPKRIFKVGKKIGVKGNIVNEILYRPYDTEYVYKLGDKWMDISRRDPEKQKLTLKYKAIEGITVPCGKCYYCRLKKAYDWAKRCWAEAKYYKYALFITFTYDDDNLTWIDVPDKNGVIEKVPTLVRDEIIHAKEIIRDRARKRGYQPAKIMLSGEYGEKNGRPHYHMILLTDDPEITNNAYLSDYTRTGYQLYGSTTLDDIWNKGIVKFSKANETTAGYTARYTLKKQYKGSQEYERLTEMGRTAEFISTTKDIGKRYLEDNKDKIKQNPTINMPKTKGTSLPKYYIDQLEKEAPEWVENLKKSNIAKQKEKIKYTEKTYNMHYDDFVKHQQFTKTKKQYEL